MMDLNGGIFEHFKKEHFIQGENFFAEVHWVIYIESDEKMKMLMLWEH